MFLVESFFQNGLHTFVEEGADGEGIGAGGFEAFLGVLLAQADDAEAGTESLLRMGFGFQDMGDEFFGIGAGLGGPADDAGGSPIEVLLVGLGHVLFESGEGTLAVTAGVTGNPFVLE